MTHRWRALASGLALLAIAPPGALAGQVAQPPGATLELRVLDAETRQPLAAAEVLVGGRLRAVTDSAGAAWLRGLPAGPLTLQLRHPGHLAREATARLQPGEAARLEVALAPDPIALAGIQAEASQRVRSRQLRGFYQRSRRGAGTYLTRDDIERLKPRQLTDLFRDLPGMVVASAPLGEKPIMGTSTSAAPDRFGRSGECPILYFIDGIPYEPSHQGLIGLDVRPNEVEGIEVYRRGSSAPMQFRRDGDNCGVILIWKREQL